MTTVLEQLGCARIAHQMRRFDREGLLSRDVLAELERATLRSFREPAGLDSEPGIPVDVEPLPLLAELLGCPIGVTVDRTIAGLDKVENLLEIIH
jgi:hypothetical protein